MINLGLACDWKRDRRKTWSHTPFSLAEAFEKQGDCSLYDLDVSLPTHQVIFRAMASSMIANGSLQTKFRFSPVYLRRIEKNLASLSRRHRQLHAILEIGDIGVTQSAPYHVYQDYSIDLLIRHYDEFGKPMPMFEAFSKDDLLKRREWQMRVYEKCSGVFAMSHWLADSLVEHSGIAATKVHVVHAGVNVKPDEALTNLVVEKRGPMILFVGRDFFRKGGDLVIEAFQLLRKDFSNQATLVIAGPRKWPMKKGIPEGIVFLRDATWDTLRQYFSSADVFCMPSRAEAFGIAFAEALCFGVPCIGRKGGAMGEIIKPGINGCLLETESPVELANLMVQLIENEKFKNRLRDLTPEYRRYYSWYRVARDMINIISKDLAHNPGLDVPKRDLVPEINPAG